MNILVDKNVLNSLLAGMKSNQKHKEKRKQFLDNYLRYGRTSPGVD